MTTLNSVVDSVKNIRTQLDQDEMDLNEQYG